VHQKRYEDEEDLLRAGINVISTVNIQHLESLYNFVEQSTGVRVKERVPDETLSKADQIVTVDLIVAACIGDRSASSTRPFIE
jgi:two-component system, OmpR family, sensor histidine kinase KdpD